MLIAGSDDGVYRISGVRGPGETTEEKLLDTERVFRVKRFDALPGPFAAAKSGLYHAADGDDWTKLPFPDEEAYAVTASPSGNRLYVGTRPARLFVADVEYGL
ncbi:MAG: WD40 repeat domain-containing protein, partial [Haladaptatus sp.]